MLTAMENRSIGRGIGRRKALREMLKLIKAEKYPVRDSRSTSVDVLDYDNLVAKIEAKLKHKPFQPGDV